jgi:DNA helicase HerA-like ATPase
MLPEAFDIQLGLRHQYHPSEIVQVPFGIRRADLRSHVYVVGKTGTGKTTLIKSVVSQAIALGMGVGVLDPHGSLIEEILDEAIPAERVQDTILFAPADRDWPVSLNLLGCAPHPSQVASGLVGAFESLGEQQPVLYALQTWTGVESVACPPHRSLSPDEVARLAEGGLIEAAAH